MNPDLALEVAILVDFLRGDATDTHAAMALSRLTVAAADADECDPLTYAEALDLLREAVR